MPVTDFLGGHVLSIIEKEAMVQDIIGNADAFSEGLHATGHVTVEGIYFDTGKSVLKPESQQAIGEIAKLLASDSALKLFVVGHTDTVGNLEANMTLSQDRAEAVVQALVRTHGVNAARLKSFGNGPVSVKFSPATGRTPICRRAPTCPVPPGQECSAS